MKAETSYKSFQKQTKQSKTNHPYTTWQVRVMGRGRRALFIESWALTSPDVKAGKLRGFEMNISIDRSQYLLSHRCLRSRSRTVMKLLRHLLPFMPAHFELYWSFFFRIVRWTNRKRPIDLQKVLLFVIVSPASFASSLVRLRQRQDWWFLTRKKCTWSL